MIHSNSIRESEGMEGMKDETSCDQEHSRMFPNFTYMQMTKQVNAKMTYKQREDKIKKLSHNNPIDVIKIA